MQPCSQPRYGFKLVSKPTSGLLLRVITDLLPSRKYCVAQRGCSSASGSSSTQSVSVMSTCSCSKRFAGLQDAPRPRTGSRLCGVSSMTGRNVFFAGTRQVHMNILHCRVDFSKNRLPSSRCASAIQIVRPLESTAETQPQLHPALLRLSAMISQYFART